MQVATTPHPQGYTRRDAAAPGLSPGPSKEARSRPRRQQQRHPHIAVTNKGRRAQRRPSGPSPSQSLTSNKKISRADSAKASTTGCSPSFNASRRRIHRSRCPAAPNAGSASSRSTTARSASTTPASPARAPPTISRSATPVTVNAPAENGQSPPYCPALSRRRPSPQHALRPQTPSTAHRASGPPHRGRRQRTESGSSYTVRFHANPSSPISNRNRPMTHWFS